MNYPKQLFILSDDILSNVTSDDIDHIVTDMKELGLYRDPYDHYTIQCSWRLLSRLNAFTEEFDDEEMNLTIERTHVKDGVVYDFEMDTPHLDNAGFLGGITAKYHEYTYTRDILIVMLATRNVERELKVRKLADVRKVGKSKHCYKYTTTISISKSLYASAEPTGRTVRPHLRRGHIKRVHYGPKYAFEKKMWIEPCFVNASSEVDVTGRDHYNVIS
jgi:hypothetical protein